MSDLPKLYHWLGRDSADASRSYREDRQRLIDAQRAAEFEMRNLAESVDE